MKERFLLNRITLDPGHVPPRHEQFSALIDADFAHPRLPFSNRTAMPAGKAADAVPLNGLVEFAFSDVVAEYLEEGGQRIPLPLF